MCDGVLFTIFSLGVHSVGWLLQQLALVLVDWLWCLSLQFCAKRRSEIHVRRAVAATPTLSASFRVSALNSGEWRTRFFLFIMVHLVRDCTHLTWCPKLVVRSTSYVAIKIELCLRLLEVQGVGEATHAMAYTALIATFHAAKTQRDA